MTCDRSAAGKSAVVSASSDAAVISSVPGKTTASLGASLAISLAISLAVSLAGAELGDRPLEAPPVCAVGAPADGGGAKTFSGSRSADGIGCSAAARSTEPSTETCSGDSGESCGAGDRCACVETSGVEDSGDDGEGAGGLADSGGDGGGASEAESELGCSGLASVDEVSADGLSVVV